MIYHTNHRWGCVYDKGNSFVVVVVGFHVAIKLPHFSNGAGVGPPFEVCISALPTLSAFPLMGQNGQADSN